MTSIAESAATEPTCDELRRAVDEVFQCIGIVGAESEAWANLRDLRRRKCTWIGEDENHLRFRIDKLLRGEI